MDYPSDPDIGLVGGKFSQGDPELGVPASLDSAAWANAVTDEILAVIAGAGLVPDEEDLTQLLQAVQARQVVVTNPNGNPNISDTMFDVNLELTPDVWRSFGPDGSGAQEIWSVLDDVPTGVKWIEVSIITSLEAPSGMSGSSYSSFLYARANGSSQAKDGQNLIAILRAPVISSTAYGANVASRKIPVSGMKFDLLMNSSQAVHPTYSLVLTGYGR
jgi:hypothetical protein